MSEAKISPDAERALLFMYVLHKGALPPWAEDQIDGKKAQLNIFRRISGLGEQEAIAAFAELEDSGMIEQD